jgi:hypothetical protein
MFPQHPRALGAGRRSGGEQGQCDEQRGRSSESHHRLPSSAVVRFTLTRSCAPQVRRLGHLGLTDPLHAGVTPRVGPLEALRDDHAF